MDETADVQGEVIGVGTVAAVVALIYGTFVSDSIVGIDAVTVAGWILAGTLVAVALLHARAGKREFTWGFGGAAVGMLFVFTGEGSRVLVGLLLLLLSGVYIAVVTRRLRREAESAG